MNIHYYLVQFVSNTLHFPVGQTYEAAFQDVSLTPESVHVWQILGKTLFPQILALLWLPTDSLPRLNIDCVTYTTN